MQISHTRSHLTIVLIILILCLPLGVFADETASTSASSTVAASTNAPAPAVTDNTRATLQPLAQTRITNLAANLSNRLDATLRRLSNVNARLGTRLEIIKASGLDTSAAATARATATGELATAQKVLSTIDIEVASFVGSENPVTAWSRLESIYRGVIKNINTAHAALGTTLTALTNATPLSAPDTSSSTVTQ